ncbi:MAG TPA: Gfo/Idh/MocA family oxidoreductase [Acidimicrobiales bacterium]|nr:Gfo/Idh/MocA family oxidoreductase [Acidimicrobiales bacterium]
MTARDQDGAPVRFGILGAARIAPSALVKPARSSPEAECRAVAARHRPRAEAFARRQRIPVVHDTYDALLADPDVDAVYIPLPNGLHARWTVAALDAGKHVLCEKPFTANAKEAEAVAARAEGSGLVVMEAFHWRYHPLAARMLEIIASGEIGPVRHVEAAFCFPLPRWSDIRWQLDLAGGALMDAGCYAVHMVRTLAGSEPEVARATARTRSPGVDRLVQAELAFAEGVTGRVTASMWSSNILRLSATVVGETGTLKAFNPIAPQFYGRLTVRKGAVSRREHVPRRATYAYQLDAFVDAVRRGAPVLTPPADSVANMRVIDSIYSAAGMEPRTGALL